MVFQSYALYPHMTVGRNIAYPLQLAGVAQGRDRPAGRPRWPGCSTSTTCSTAAVAALGRAAPAGGDGPGLVRRPQAFLMDEPLSNLDAKLRVEMRAEISRLQRELAVTTVYVTHDQVEAMTMGDRVAVLDDGRVQQVGPPQALYDGPANLFVATFIGSPALEAARRHGRGAATAAPGAAGRRPPARRSTTPSGRPPRGSPGCVGRPVVVGIRPEAFADVGGSTRRAGRPGGRGGRRPGRVARRRDARPRRRHRPARPARRRRLRVLAPGARPRRTGRRPPRAPHRAGGRRRRQAGRRPRRQCTCSTP